MNRRLLLAFLCVWTALLGGCGTPSPRPDYFLLSADAAPAVEKTTLTLGIATFDVAEYLRRVEMVTLAGSNRLRIDPYRRWAEPLDEGMRRILALNLAALLGTDSVRTMPWPRDWVPHWLLRCSIVRLDVKDDAIDLVAVWSLQDGKRKRAARRAHQPPHARSFRRGRRRHSRRHQPVAAHTR